MRTLHDKVTVITGAGSGMGRALALDTGGRGAVLALSDVDDAGLAETADLVEKRTRRRPRTDRLDVRDREAMKAYAAEIAEHFGRVNVVVNNAGIGLQGDLTDISYEQLQRVVDIDFWGVVHGSKEFLPHLIASGDGHLVNMSSMFGIVTAPSQTAYCAAKFAVRGFTESLRQEMLTAGHPVGVTCVHPGSIRTGIAYRTEMVADEETRQRYADLFETKLARVSPEQAAAAIIKGVLSSKPGVLIGADARFADVLARAGGSAYQRLMARATRAVQSRI